MTVKLSADGVSLAGDVEAHALVGRGLNVHEIAEMMTRKLVHVADTAPPVIKEQAHEFRGKVQALCTHYLKQAIRSHHTTLWNVLTKEGHMEAAYIIMKFEI